MAQAETSDRSRFTLIATVLIISTISLLQPGCNCGTSDALAPAPIASVFPEPNSSNALAGTNVIAVFGIDMDEATINETTFTLTEVGGAEQSATVSYDVSSRTAVLNPAADLISGTQYRATISSSIRDAAGNSPLSSDYSWSFTVSESIALVSLNSSGVSANNTSKTSDISTDGRYIVFESAATNLVSGTTTGGLTQIFRKDMLTGEVVLVSSDDTGLVAADANCASPRISSNGRYVVFQSTARNLDDEIDSGGRLQIYLKNIDSNTINLVSRDSLLNPDNGTSGATDASVSDNGRFIVFQSSDPDLSPTPGNTSLQVYRKDISDEEVEMISRTSGGTAGDNDSLNADISPDGRHIVFESVAVNLGAIGGVQHILYVDTAAATHTTELISTSTSGDSNRDSFNASVSDDGSLVVFETDASNLDALDSNGAIDIYIRNRSLLSTDLVSVNATGTNGGNSDSTNAHINGSGIYVTFESRASDIDGGTLGVRNIFVRDLSAMPTIDTKRINIPVSGAATTSASSDPRISSDGRYVSFDSDERYTLEDNDSFIDVYRVQNSTYQ